MKIYAGLICNRLEVKIKNLTITESKPPHNKDPFPVDSKIEEFETHLPRVKINQIVTHIHGKAPSIAAVQQFDMTEKRLVRLENNISTLMRYLFRLGARVFINCQFYGGQTTFEKGCINISKTL